MQRYALVTGLSDEEPANIELLHEGPQRGASIYPNTAEIIHTSHSSTFRPYAGLHRTDFSTLRSCVMTKDFG